MSKIYVLLSGGIDSTACLALAVSQVGPEQVTAASVLYGQKHTKEIMNAQRVAQYFKVKHKLINLKGVMGIGGLSDADSEVPEVAYEDLPHGISPTYVPFRNGLMLSALASIAMSDEDARSVMYGAHAEDAENDAYPDCSEDFVYAMAEAIHIGTYEQVELEAPFVTWTKAEVIYRMDRLSAPWHLTWSCYKGGDKHCGVCSTCRARKEAFTQAGTEDPTEYAR